MKWLKLFFTAKVAEVKIQARWGWRWLARFVAWFAVCRVIFIGEGSVAQSLPREDISHRDRRAVQLNAMRAHVHPAQLGLVAALGSSQAIRFWRRA